MRAAALVALLLAGCTAAPGAPPSPTSPAAAAPTATPTSAPTAPPTAPPSATPEANTVFTADDEAIAILIRAGADEAIPELKGLRDSDPQKLEDLFLPLGTWITSQKEGVEALTPSSCTTAAVTLFLKGIDQYDAIREQFLAWRDWGAQRHAFPVAAPGQAVKTLEAAVVELEAHCPA